MVLWFEPKILPVCKYPNNLVEHALPDALYPPSPRNWTKLFVVMSTLSNQHGHILHWCRPWPLPSTRPPGVPNRHHQHPSPLCSSPFSPCSTRFSFQRAWGRGRGPGVSPMCCFPHAHQHFVSSNITAERPNSYFHSDVTTHLISIDLHIRLMLAITF